MKIDISPADLEPFAKAIAREAVAETIAQAATIIAAPEDRLAFDESEAARMLGVAKHVLRDCRLRGEIKAANVGRKVVYRRAELLDFLNGQY